MSDDPQSPRNRIRSPRLSALPMMLLTAMALGAPASAAPPPVGALATFLGDHNQVLVCDTLEEIEQIFYADDRQTAFLGLYRSLNAKGFRACEVVNTSGYVLSVIPLGAVRDDDTPILAWGLQLGTEDPGYSFWVLHLEPPLTA